MNTKTEVRHTPTPWKTKPFPGLSDCYMGIVGSNGEWAKLTTSNAAFIVRCVNSHEALLQAAKNAVAVLGNIPACGDIIGAKVTKAMLGVINNGLNKAIAQAEGKI